MGTVLVAPLVHTSAESGKPMPAPLEAEYSALVERYYRELAPQVLAYAPLQVYQDSYVGRMELVEKFADSPNMRLVRELLSRGAALEPTEDPLAVLAAIMTETVSAFTGDFSDVREVTEMRDRAVAKRIEETLTGRGALLMGAGHQVERYLTMPYETVRCASLTDVMEWILEHPQRFTPYTLECARLGS